MGIRTVLGSTLESAIGHDRANRLRALERRGRNGLAKRLTVAPATAPKGRPPASPWGPNDPQVPHPSPRMTRHELLAGLHERLAPRTYLEVGVNTGASLALARCPSIGVDPAFKIDKELHCDVRLFRMPSDDFFAAEGTVEHFAGVPVDLAFIDGMHLSDYALRDFINAEPLMARTGVVVVDDVLPRNPLEAARNRKTNAWAGDIYKVIEVLLRRREDLVVLLVNTAPTGTAVIVGVDPASQVLSAAYDEETPFLLKDDPQQPPDEFMDRSIAVEPQDLLDSPAWAQLVAVRETPDPDLTGVLTQLRALRR